jgi:hypothetical protein
VTIQGKIGEAQLHIATMKAATDKSSDASQQFSQREGFSEIVVGTGVQPGNSLLDQTSGREHHHWSFNALLAEFTADLKSTDTGKANVEKDSVIRYVGG